MAAPAAMFGGRLSRDCKGRDSDSMGLRGDRFRLDCGQ
jgi:hypothetical protein